MLWNILINHGADINSRMKNGWTPIHIAIDRKLPEVVELLIKHSADINIQDADLGGPPYILPCTETCQKL